MLWVALELPALPLQLVERAGVSPSPLVVADGPAQRPAVLCANAAAREAGVLEGMAVAAAKALAGALKSVARDASEERACLERLAGWAAQFTPAVVIESDGLLLEVQASLNLFGGLAKLLAALRQGIRALGFQATVGIAPTPLAARLFARAQSRGITVRTCSDASELGARLADLPLFLLDWPEKTLALLADLGLLRLKDLLALPRDGLSQRFGPDTLASLDRLLGRIPDPRVSYIAPPRYSGRLELPCEAEGVESILFPLKRLLAEMAGVLRGRGAGVQQLRIELEHSGKARTRICLEFASPEREPEFILSIAREKLSRTTLPAATIVLHLVADHLLAYSPKEETWLPGREERAMGRVRLVERLSARLGPGRVFGIALADDHRPERGWKRTTAAARLSFDGGARPAWLLQRPQRLVAEAGKPTLQGPLDLIAGPERIETGWWDGEPVSRDYFVAANPSGETYWVYRELREPAAWYVHGVFA